MFTKKNLLDEFRNVGDEILSQGITKDKKKNAQLVNDKIKKYRDEKYNFLKKLYSSKKITNEELVNYVLLISYVSDLIMLEYRNKVWKYEYMAFSRRVGEIWEPFCKLAFEYSIKPLEIFTPQKFSEVQEVLKNEAISYISGLKLDERDIKKLIKFYKKPWDIVESGEVNLSLDLHFRQNGINYNCDFKSGFSSNEKGNTNRLLTVASVYREISEKEKTIIFVRQSEDENNHYLQILRESQQWDVYCADECYNAIKKFTGFDLRMWIDKNIDWLNDVTPEFAKDIKKNNFEKYLKW